MLAELPPDFSTPIVIVQHRPEELDLLASLLRQRCRREVQDAVDGEEPRPGNVYVAHPTRQLQFDAEGRFLQRSQPNGRGTADLLFASAERCTAIE
jgi:chemotaxis response regulator CheB